MPNACDNRHLQKHWEGFLHMQHITTNCKEHGKEN